MKKTLLFLSLALIFTACDFSNSHSGYHSFSDILWHKKDKPTFEFELIKEAHYSVKIDLRLVYGYTYRNIKMQMQISNESVKNTKSIDFMVRNEDDSYKGDIMGDIIDIEEVVYSDTILPAGKYKFNLEQFMDDKTLPFVMEVGVVLTEIKQDRE